MENEKRLIDANALKQYLKDYRFEFVRNEDFAKALEMIDCAPQRDAVEVVRCKDCVHRKERVCLNPSAGMWVGVELKDSDFCSYGERREGE